MGQIPAEDKTSEATVTEMKATLAAKEQVEGTLKARLATTEQRIGEMTTDAGNASAEIYIAEASAVGDEELDRLRQIAAGKIGQLDATRRERDALKHAVAVAAGQTSDARMALVRTQHKAHINRVAKLLERLLAETVRLENSIDTSVGHYKTILKHLDTLRSSWPGGDLPPISELTTAGLTVAIEQHLYKVGTVIDPTLNMPTVKFPGARAHDLTLLGQPERLPSISDGINSARRWLLDILEGKREARSGVLLTPTSETAAATPAA